MSVGVTLRDSTSDVDPQGLPVGTTANPLKVTTVSSGGVEATAPSVLSTANSSEALLGISAVFTGTAVDALQYGTIMVTAFSDVASAANGLSIQQSKNGTNWDVTDTYTISAGASSKISVPRQEQYVRVVYTNGGTIQATFRLSTILDPRMPRSSSIKPQDGLNVENDMDAAISVQTTYNGTTLDLARSIVNAVNSTGTGITAVGLVAQLDDTTPTTITENQFGALRMTPSRALIVYQNASPSDAWNYAAATSGIVNTTTAVTIKAAGGAGIRNYIKSLQVATDTLGAATELAVRDGAAGTVLWRGKLGTAALPQTTINFDPPLRGTAATLMEVVTLTASVTGGVFVNAQGFTGP